MKNNIKKGMDVVFLLDRSGSMSGTEKDTIGGYNSYLNDMKDKDVKITTVLFDDRYEMICERVNVSNVEKLDNNVYYPRGCTALMDAIGRTIKFMDEKNSKKVLFIITTDGEENSSVEYNKEQIKELILGHKNWEFIYLGADIDSYKEARSIGISSNRTSNYIKSDNGIEKMFNAVKKMSYSYENCDCICDNWKDELNKYIDENKE